tara:strand:+ start:114058 stop:115353 length:1296 start_codon:yes stop_codon:yes gene_type:complete
MSESQVTPAPLLGCVADDVTGATDLANNLVSAGMRVIQFLAPPTADQIRDAPADAIVVALKTRSIEPRDAVNQSVRAIRVLRDAGCRRFFFKYCSTFDSTPRGNIGPVSEAVMNELREPQTIYCPAFPRAGRTVYRGHLFVGDRLLSESGMQDHPINPMHDADLTRVLAAQVTQPVGLAGYEDLTDAASINRSLRKHRDEQVAHVVIDACDDSHLRNIADAVSSMRFVTGGSGIASFLPQAYRRLGLLEPCAVDPPLPHRRGRSLILSGSCSSATNRQVAAAMKTMDAWAIDVAKIVDDFDGELSRIADWIEQSDPKKPLIVYSTSDPDTVARLQEKMGVDEAANTVERFFGRLACTSISRFDIGTLIVAGGETSGSVVQAIGVNAIRIGPEICAGVPWTESLEEPSIALALKSGNFGDDNFFTKALEMLS